MDNSTRLIQLRSKLGLSQATMAREFGVSRSTLTHWENGTYPIPEIALNLLSLYEEFADEELALKRHENVIRKLSTDWTSRIVSSFAKGARTENRKQIKNNLEKSLFTFLRHELSPYQIKRNLQVAAFNRVVDVAAKSKGIPMKLIQAMTFMNPAMAPEAREALERIFELQAPMAPTLVARILTEDFGQSPSKLFAEWSPKPFATASIGQVHRARLKTGEAVAVKVQYPDIQKSLQNDFSYMSVFADFISIFYPDARAIADKIKKAILDEVDYYLERDYLESFGKLFEGSDRIIIPKTYPRHCSHRVLTMDYIEGKTLKEFKSAPVHERQLAAETIATFITKTAFQNGLMNTDTNAGNFIFCGGGKVAFIDFGRACKVEIDGAGELLKAIILKDEATARSYFPKMFPLKAQKKSEAYPYSEIWYFFLKQQAHLHNGPFRFTREYIAQNMNDGREFPLKRDLHLSIDMIWSLATSMGLWNVLADLDVAVDYGKISLDVLSQPVENTSAILMPTMAYS